MSLSKCDPRSVKKVFIEDWYWMPTFWESIQMFNIEFQHNNKVLIMIQTGYWHAKRDLTSNQNFMSLSKMGLSMLRKAQQGLKNRCLDVDMLGKPLKMFNIGFWHAEKVLTLVKIVL